MSFRVDVAINAIRAAALVCAAWGFASSSVLAEPLNVVSETAPPQPNATRFVVHSDRIGRDFWVTVSRPAATVFLPGQKLPVIYALDGGNGVAGPEGQFLGNVSSMAPAVIVSVGYAPGQGRFRLIDLAHGMWKPLEPSLPRTGGGGGAFETFLLEELKPFIEARYPVDPKRSVLFGHSLGGTFAANVFANHPGAFAGYVMSSVAVWVDPGVVDRVAAAAARAKNVRVYLSVAEFDDGPNTTEMRPAFDALTRALSKRPGLALKTQVYPRENHISYYPRLVLDSFPFVLPSAWLNTSPQMPMRAEVMARYAGAYRMPDGREIAIRATDDGELLAQFGGGNVAPLLQNGRDRFYAPSADVDIAFDARGADLSGGGAALRVVRAP